MSQSTKQIIERQEEILNRISQIRLMERGTVSPQRYAERAGRKGGAGAVGPYYLWQGTVKGKRFGKRLSGEEAERVAAGIARRHAFEALCEEYVELSCHLSAAGGGGESEEVIKKKPRSRSSEAKK